MCICLCGYMCPCQCMIEHAVRFVPPPVSYYPTSVSPSLPVQIRMSARILEAQCVAPGAARTPLAPIVASWAASPASREKTPQAAVSGQTLNSYS